LTLRGRATTGEVGSLPIGTAVRARESDGPPAAVDGSSGRHRIAPHRPVATGSASGRGPWHR